MKRFALSYWLAVLAIVFCCAAGCDFGPLDDASTRGARVNGNRYFEATDAYPMYWIILHDILRYDPSNEEAYYRSALDLALPVLRNDEGNPRKEQVEYVVLIIYDLRDGTPTFEERHCSARVFSRKGIVRAGGDWGRLIQATPLEPRPLSSSAASGMSAGGPIVVRHAAAHGHAPPATQEGVQP